MKKHTACIIGEQIGEGLIGASIATVLNKTVLPKCNTKEGIVVLAGAAVGTWALSRNFAKTYFKWCDQVFGTEFVEEWEVDKNL